MEAAFQTQRRRLISAYKDTGNPFVISTVPYQSVGVFKADIVDRLATSRVAWAKFSAPQTIHFFSYGVGQEIDLGGDQSQRATEADTNLARARSTNGASDFVIEGLSLYQRGIRLAHQNAAANPTASLADEDVIAAMLGRREILDPGAIYTPPQVHSPFNLENALFNALTPLVNFTIEFDRKRIFRLTSADILPQGAASSYLRSNGVPHPGCLWNADEGFLWRRDGESDSELEVNMTLQRDLLVPINLPLLPDDAAGVTDDIDALWVQVGCRVHGIQVDFPSEN